MNRHAIAGRLSLRPPQRRSLEILDRITEIAPPKKGAVAVAVLGRPLRASFRRCASRLPPAWARRG